MAGSRTIVADTRGAWKVDVGLWLSTLVLLGVGDQVICFDVLTTPHAAVCLGSGRGDRSPIHGEIAHRRLRVLAHEYV